MQFLFKHLSLLSKGAGGHCSPRYSSKVLGCVQMLSCQQVPTPRGCADRNAPLSLGILVQHLSHLNLKAFETQQEITNSKWGQNSKCRFFYSVSKGLCTSRNYLKSFRWNPISSPTHPPMPITLSSAFASFLHGTSNSRR